MKVGNIINGLIVTDVKRVNKLNLIQFLKEVDSYLQQGYKLDVQSGRQVGLVLMADMYKTEGSSSTEVGSTEVNSTDTESTESPSTANSSPTEEGVAEDASVQEVAEQPKENVAVEPVEEVVKEEIPVAPKKTSTRSKKTAQ